MAYIFTRPDSDIVMMAKIEARETSCKMIFDWLSAVWCENGRAGAKALLLYANAVTL